MSKKNVVGLQTNEMDNVATVFSDIDQDQFIDVVDKKGHRAQVKAISSIPYGHKVAIREIRKGQSVTKYGEEIGLAVADIRIGDHVHVHNMESARARGDWSKGGAAE